MPLTVAAARTLGKRLGVWGLLIVAIDDDGTVRTVTWGRTRRECDAMQPLGDDVAQMLADGEIGPLPPR